MTIAEAIQRTDDLEPNQYSSEQKMRWLTTLDGQIFEEIVKTHLDPIRDSFEEYTETEDELLVPFPYAENLYIWYLQAMIAANNAEAAKYEQMRTLYNSSLQQFSDWYNRTHQPKGGPRFWF